MYAFPAILALLSFTVLSMLGIYLFYSFLTNFQPGKNKIKKDLKALKQSLAPFITDLIPLKKEELDLLSPNQVNRSRKKGMKKTTKGVFTTIYHEPVIAYAYKKYISNGKDENAVIYACTTDKEFVYRIKSKSVEFFINDQLIGELQKESLLYSAQSKRLIARINRPEDQLLQPIIIRDKEVASLINLDKNTKTAPRALQFLTPMEEDEMTVMLSLSIFEMVRKTNKNK